MSAWISKWMRWFEWSLEGHLVKEAWGTHPVIHRWPRPRTEVPSLWGVLVKHGMGRTIVLAFSLSLSFSLDLSLWHRLHSQVGSLYRMADSYQQRQAFSTLNANWTTKVVSPLTSAEGPEAVLIGPGMTQSLWSRVCNALISQLGTQDTTLGHGITFTWTSGLRLRKGWISIAFGLQIPEKWRDTGQRTNVCSLNHRAAKFWDNVSRKPPCMNNI